MKTPVLFLIFNRPDVTRRVFESIRNARPQYLYVSADGPRADRPTEKQLCEDTRSIINQVDWDCKVKTLYREHNLGCRKAVSSGIDWFFENVEEGIILEDDCLPHPDFFPFCETLLERFRNQPKVMHISGGNFQFGKKHGDASYYFSRISHIWGWASWRRAWKMYDVDMKDFHAFERSHQSFFINKKLEAYWLFHFRRMFRGADTWDYQWTYAVMKNQGYCIIPSVNLITNIGFGEQATHAVNTRESVASIGVAPLGEWKHPESMDYNDEADRFTVEKAFPIPPFYRRAFLKAKKELTRIFK